MALLRLVLALLAPAAFAGTISLSDIRREQDLRANDSAALKAAAAAPSPALRRQAYAAMGRIQSESYLGALLEGLRDADENARRQAVFSIGQMGLAEPALSTATIARAAVAVERFSAGVKGPLKRASVEALGKLGGAPSQPRLLAALMDADASVRGEAALALFRQRQLKRVVEYSTASVEALTASFSDRDPEVRWRAVYAFSRFPEPRAAKALAKEISDAEPRARFFAWRALGQLKEGMPAVKLPKKPGENDAFTRAEAVRALGSAGRANEIDDDLLADPSSHVRAAAAEALGAAGAPELAAKLDRLLADASPMVQGQALLAAVKVKPADAFALLVQARGSADWRLRLKAYEALGAMPGSEALLKEGLKDGDARVAAAALESLAKSSSTEIDALLAKIFRDSRASLELAGTAAEAAKDRKSPGLLDAVRSAYEGKLARRYPELADDLFAAYDETLKAHPELKKPPLKERPKAKIALSPYFDKRPKAATVVLETDRGNVEILLAVEDAPIHAATFLSGVKKKIYDGTIWHRVVSGFVVQGGDPRGSGWGDGGVSLRDEINALAFERGAVGMPKAGKDTGGCQLFITHVPTPHLDGRYTVFGRVVSGLDAVDRLEPGDRIRRAYLK